eukprot:2907865-Pyramimonas_sp.AAC.1
MTRRRKRAYANANVESEGRGRTIKPDDKGRAVKMQDPFTPEPTLLLTVRGQARMQMPLAPLANGSPLPRARAAILFAPQRKGGGGKGIGEEGALTSMEYIAGYPARQSGRTLAKLRWKRPPLPPPLPLLRALLLLAPVSKLALGPETVVFVISEGATVRARLSSGNQTLHLLDRGPWLTVTDVHANVVSAHSGGNWQAEADEEPILQTVDALLICQALFTVSQLLLAGQAWDCRVWIGGVRDVAVAMAAARGAPTDLNTLAENPREIEAIPSGPPWDRPLFLGGRRRLGPRRCGRGRRIGGRRRGRRNQRGQRNWRGRRNHCQWWRSLGLRQSLLCCGLRLQLRKNMRQ